LAVQSVAHYKHAVKGAKILLGPDTSPDFDSGASLACTDVLKSNSSSWADLIRAERTRGNAAVSGTTGETVRGDSRGFHPESPTMNPLPLTSVATTRLVGFFKLKSLLQPIHSFFKKRRGWIDKFYIYDDSNENTTRRLVYPKVKAEDRLNPYRRYQLNNKASARTFKRVKQFVEHRKLDDFKVASVIPTMPKFMSEYLAANGEGGRGMAWRLFDGFWSEDIPEVIGQDIELGCHVNLHLWRTEKPYESHFHFHTLIPNYGLKFAGDEDEDGQPAMTLVRWEWHRQRGGALVPFSDEQREALNKLWMQRLGRFCRRHGLAFDVKSVDIYVEYIDDWAKLHHRFNYNGRHWTENYAEYSNIHPECPDPPEWLMRYENKARVKGWWSNLKNMSVESQDKIKVSPYTGGNMTYLDTNDGVTLDSLVRYAGTLGYVEFIKGKALENDMTDEQIEWLRGVMIYMAKGQVESFSLGAAYETEENESEESEYQGCAGR
jgi:hypothetical protein